MKTFDFRVDLRGFVWRVLVLVTSSALSLKYLIPAKKFTEVSVRATAFNFSPIYKKALRCTQRHTKSDI